jgi:16S rRNA (adenine1518-N6/adenine1519-N6)-dimethyltransferase
VTPVDSRARLREAGLHPKKSFGQNFLVTEAVARAIAVACVPDAEVGRARVVELGAGLGALTALLAERSARVVAVERDRDLVPILRATLDDPRVEVVEADAQGFDVAGALGPSDAPRVLCGNLPYQITGRLLQLAVDSAASIDRAVFMVQQEVCDRLVASPATKAYGALTVFVRAAFDVRRVMNVARGSFHPPPDVTSSVVELTALRPPRAMETTLFRAVVKRAFEARRKTLRNAWSGVAPSADALARAAAAAGISLDLRGETLDVDAFARMAKELERGAPEGAPAAQ